MAKVFALELSQLAEPQRQQLLDGLLAISIWSFWEALRTELGLGPAQAEELLRVTFTALLTAAGPSCLCVSSSGRDDHGCRGTYR